MFKKILYTIILVLFLSTSAYCTRQIVTMDVLGGSKALTVSGGATPSSTSGVINIEKSTGLGSLYLKNSGTSTSLTVTYQIGVDTKGYNKPDDYIWMTPSDGGTVTALTTVSIAGSQAHESVQLAVGTYRFIVTNVDAVNTATVNLYLDFQVAE